MCVLLHSYQGYATMLIGLAQPIIAYYRPGTAKEKESTGYSTLETMSMLE